MNARTLRAWAVIVTSLALLALSAPGQVPQQLNYEGRLLVGSTNFNGAGQFKFALVDGGTNTSQTAIASPFVQSGVITSIGINVGGSGYVTVPNVTITDPNNTGSGATAMAVICGGQVTGINVTNGGLNYSTATTVTIDPPPPNIVTVTYWSNDGTSSAGSEPTSAVPLGVTNGLYHVMLGDTSQTNMATLPSGTFSVPGNIYLRVWFNDGTHGSQQLSPDQQIASVAYSMIAATANMATSVPNGSIGSNQLASGLSVTGTFNAPILALPASDIRGGFISLGGTPFLQDYGTNNAFVGSGAGNFTMTGTDNVALGSSALAADSTGSSNIALGSGALEFNSTGSHNVAIGAQALFTQSYATPFSTDNVAVGFQALYSNQPSALQSLYGTDNTAIGSRALYANTIGFANMAAGFQALNSNTTGYDNTASGDQALYLNIGGVSNTADGCAALVTNSSGSFNTASGANALGDNTIGDFNTALGAGALFNNNAASYNTAVGYTSLYYNTAPGNTAVGFQSLYNNSTSSQNVALGYQALYSQSFSNNGSVLATSNVAVGYQALYSNQPSSTPVIPFNFGIDNTAVGTQSLYSNVSGNNNTGIGYGALYNNSSGPSNTATGTGALYSNTTGGNNTALGTDVLYSNTAGGGNTAVGLLAMANSNANNNCAFGTQALYDNSTGTNNIAIGYFAGFSLTTGSNNIDIFDPGVAGEGNTIRIGTQGTQTKTIIAGISGVTISGGSPVSVSSSGQLGITSSSRRFKTDIAPMGDASSVLFALRPVSFHYKPEIDPTALAQFGLIAEEVNEVNPDLVIRDQHGAVQSVRYEQINAMLLNEFLKEHRHAEEKDAEIAKLKDRLAELEARDKDREARLSRLENLLPPSTLPAVAKTAENNK